MKKSLFVWLALSISLLGYPQYKVFSQNTVGVVGQDSTNHVITTAVPFLTITPDSRAAGMGDAGVATSPDANSVYWNPSKLAFIDQGSGVTTSYTPWLAKIINDMKLIYLSGFYRIDRNQVVAASLKYFDMGAIQFNHGPDPSQQDGRYNPKEYGLDVSYSRRLTEFLSLGGTLRYIRSNLTGANPSTPDARAGNSVAVDIGTYYSKQLSNRNAILSLAAAITNIGSKMTYTSAANKDFIPTNLRLGGAYKTHLDPVNTLTFALDFNKLMVPSPGPNSKSKPMLSGMLGSFSDAQGGFSEEIREITVSYGMEYWYKEFFAVRTGYFFEAKDKGNRKYLTAGIGLRLEMSQRDMLGVDMAYMIPTTIGQSALAETIRFTVSYLLPVKEVKQTDSPD
jgi:hypothetical protein